MSLPVVQSITPESITLEPGDTKHVDVVATIEEEASTVLFTGFVRLDGSPGDGTPVQWSATLQGGLDPNAELDFGVYGQVPAGLVQKGVSVTVSKTGAQSARYTFTRAA